MTLRRTALQQGAVLATLLLTTGFWPKDAAAFNQAAFSAGTLADAVASYSAVPLLESAEVQLQVPALAESGASVPVSLGTTLSGVQRLLLLVEKNPAPLVAMFEVNAAVLPQFALRTKMSQSSAVYAVAVLTDGRVLYARQDVQVTVGSCG